MKLNINLNQQDIKIAISEYIKNHRGLDVSTNDVGFNIEKQCVGYGMGEHMETVFSGATVHIND